MNKKIFLIALLSVLTLSSCSSEKSIGDSIKKYCASNSESKESGVPRYTNMFSKNGKGFFFIEKQDTLYNIIFNGTKIGPSFNTYPQDVYLSDDGKNIASFSKSESGYGTKDDMLIINGFIFNEGVPFLDGKFQFSPDGKKFIFGRTEDKNYVINICPINAKNSGECEKNFNYDRNCIIPGNTSFIGGEHFFFNNVCASGDEPYSVIKDGVNFSVKDKLNTPVRTMNFRNNQGGIIISPDGEKIVFGQKKDMADKYYLVENGKETNMEIVMPPVFSNDSKDIAYLSQDSSGVILRRNGVPQGDYIPSGQYEFGSMIFSENNAHIYYVGIDLLKDRLQLFKDGINIQGYQVQLMYPKSSLIVSPNGDSYIWLLDDGTTIIKDGVTLTEKDVGYTAGFSPNGNHWSFTTQEFHGSRLVIDGAKDTLNTVNELDKPVYSPDGESIVYNTDRESIVYKNFSESGSSILENQIDPSFSPGGTYFMTTKHDRTNGILKETLLINGKEICK